MLTITGDESFLYADRHAEFISASLEKSLAQVVLKQVQDDEETNHDAISFSVFLKLSFQDKPIN